MTFRKKRNYGIPAVLQGYLYYLCLRYNEINEDTKLRIRTVCRRAAGEDDKNYYALLDAITHSYPMQKTAMNYCMDVSNLSRLVKKFYQLWDFGSGVA